MVKERKPLLEIVIKIEQRVVQMQKEWSEIDYNKLISLRNTCHLLKL